MSGDQTPADIPMRETVFCIDMTWEAQKHDRKCDIAPTQRYIEEAF